MLATFGHPDAYYDASSTDSVRTGDHRYLLYTIYYHLLQILLHH